MKTPTPLFADKETSSMLKDMGFDEPCHKYFLKNTLTDEWKEYKNLNNWEIKNSDFKEGTIITSPIWQQIEEWLFNKQGKLWIHVYRYEGAYYWSLRNEGIYLITNSMEYYDPNTAHIYGIIAAVKYKWEQFKNDKI